MLLPAIDVDGIGEARRAIDACREMASPSGEPERVEWLGDDDIARGRDLESGRPSPLTDISDCLSLNRTCCCGKLKERIKEKMKDLFKEDPRIRIGHRPLDIVHP